MPRGMRQKRSIIVYQRAPKTCAHRPELVGSISRGAVRKMTDLRDRFNRMTLCRKQSVRGRAAWPAAMFVGFYRRGHPDRSHLPQKGRSKSDKWLGRRGRLLHNWPSLQLHMPTSRYRSGLARLREFFARAASDDAASRSALSRHRARRGRSRDLTRRRCWRASKFTVTESWKTYGRGWLRTPI